MQRPLNILFLCSWYPSPNHPTLGNFIQKHAEAAGKFNKVTTLSLHATDGGSRFVDRTERNGIVELRVFYPKTRGVFKKIVQFFQWRKAMALGVETHRNLFGQPDVIHLNVVFPLGLRVKKFFQGIPMVITEHSSGLHQGPNAYPKWMVNRMIPVFRRAKMILPVSANLGERIKALSGASYQVLPNVVHEEVFTIGENSPHLNRLVHISTAFEPAKNVLGMLRAVNLLAETRTDFEFHIISDGDVSDARKLAKSMGMLDRVVFFHGTKSTEEVASFLRNCKALVLFSNFENFPCVIPEAWMSGVPVITTAVNGIPEFANESNGILVERGNEAQLAEAMRAILDGKTFDASALRTYALTHFSYEAVGKQLDEVYKNLM
jgi:glycosyltransferase involved in cell wall biosynthesis